MKKPGKTLELTTTVQVESWRQRLNVNFKEFNSNRPKTKCKKAKIMRI